jgi:hypothetical protein
VKAYAVRSGRAILLTAAAGNRNRNRTSFGYEQGRHFMDSTPVKRVPIRHYEVFCLMWRVETESHHGAFQ